MNRLLRLARDTTALTTWATCAGVVVALVAAGITLSQIHVAKEQNEVAEQLALTTLVTELARETSAVSGSSGEQQRAIAQARLGDAEEAFALIGTLHRPAPAIDDFEIGLAFEAEHEAARAIASFTRAAAATSSPHYRSAALLQEAAILFGLGTPSDMSQARADAVLASHAYDRQPDTTRFIVYYNRAYAELWGADRDSDSVCAQELRVALQALESEPEARPELNGPLALAEHRCANGQRSSAGQTR